MNHRFIRVGDQTFAISHITAVRRLGELVEICVVSSPEAFQLTGRDAEAFWTWHTSAIQTLTRDRAIPVLS